MPAQLQPLVELAVVGEQRVCSLRVEDPGGAGDVPGEQRALEATLILFDEATQRSRHCRLFGIGESIPGKPCEQRPAMHYAFHL